MPKPYISNFKVSDLWGRKDFDLDLYKDVNIIIGPNASGKTTLLNLLNSILAPNFDYLNEIDFSSAKVSIQDNQNGESTAIHVERTEKGYSFSINGNSPVEIPMPPTNRRTHLSFRRRGLQKKLNSLFERVDELVKLVWLPVSRRLPVSDEEEEYIQDKPSQDLSRRRTKIGLESVNRRLEGLLKELEKYKLKLDSQLSERYKGFEREVLQMFLYGEEHDKDIDFEILVGEETSLVKEKEKEKLLKAFEVAEILNSEIRERVDKHFEEARKGVKRLRKRFNEETEADEMDISDFFIIPLMSRTKQMVKYAKELTEDRGKIYQPVEEYKKTVNSFFKNKEIDIEDGEVAIKLAGSDQQVKPRMLSSGEKQLLILLTQALLSENKPVIYLADEPELSLHIGWQKKLIESINNLGYESQIIVATHSPDIVGDFTEKVIELNEQ